jgi:hypothetical protein
VCHDPNKPIKEEPVVISDKKTLAMTSSKNGNRLKPERIKTERCVILQATKQSNSNN